MDDQIVEKLQREKLDGPESAVLVNQAAVIGGLLELLRDHARRQSHFAVQHHNHRFLSLAKAMADIVPQAAGDKA